MIPSGQIIFKDVFSIHSILDLGVGGGAVSIFGVADDFLLGQVVLLCPDCLHEEHGILSVGYSSLYGVSQSKKKRSILLCRQVPVYNARRSKTLSKYSYRKN